VSVTVDTFGAGYTSDPTVSFSDAVGSGTGASATATTDIGAVTAINLTAGGSDYVTSGGIKKFVDGLPGLCDPNVPGSCPDWIADPAAKAIPVGVPAKIKYNGVMSDQYEIGLVQYQSSFSSSLPPTLSRGYVQLKPCTGAPSDYHLTNTLLGGGTVDTGYCGWTPPQWLGPVIAATKDLPVRIIFRNLLPTGSGGDLIIPTDSTLMGSGMADVPMYDPQDLGTVTDEARNPLCTQYPKSSMCFKDNRATLHMHGGITPWISDGTPHQWITPAGEGTAWPQGVSVSNVPDMAAAGCDGTTDGCMTFYYTNQQSARLLFYHDHAWGITRLGVYVGGAAGYLISDDTEQALITNDVIPGAAASIPLVIQDRTFVPQDTQMYNQYDADGNITSYGQDPTWDASRWGGYGSFWFHHVYMPAQNPGDPSGMSGYGRWMYGPWFWPPAGATKFGPIANPYFGKDPKGPDGKRGTADDWTSDLATACNLDDPATWQYDTDPFCEPELIPGTPNISTGMEQFNDTPIVNGVAYPTVTLEPKTYRFRVLNAANDRFFNFQWYVGDPATASTSLNANGDVIGATEVALNPAELAAAQTDPVVFPTPVQGAATAGPDWIQIGTEGGFLPAPVVVDGQQPTTWVTDPTRFDVGNVDLHSLLLAPAERADVIVDFSKFAGKTLILYNDGPAAFPARVPSYDYYTGAPDLSPVGAPAILPGYGPNTRTIMQVKIAGTPAPAFNLTKLRNAFSHKANGTGVFESGQHPIIVGQAAYNLAYGTRFPGGSNCNVPINTVTTTLPSCDGFVRVNDTSLFGFNTLKAPATRMVMPLEPKAIHDEMNSTTFDEWGRMQATLGIEAQPPTPGVQNVTLYPYVNPQTELIDATNLPKNDVTWDAGTGLPVSDVKITPIANAADGSQIWRITHNGVDTHPIHFHLYDVQVLNRVTWDNIIIPAEPTELGWKDTVRVSPLEDTIVALRPIIPELPWELPNAIRNLSPMMSTGSTQYFNNIDPQGNPTAAITNTLVNFGWEYVYHCHILTHEEMDMMRPVSVAMPPVTPSGLAAQVVQVGSAMKVTLTWNDNSIAETSHLIQRRSGTGAWTSVGTVASPLNVTNTTGSRTFDDATGLQGGMYDYRVVAQNEVGYQDGAGPGGFPSTIATATSNVVSGVVVPLAAPTDLTATYAFAAITLSWTDNTGTENGFAIERAVGAGAFAPLTTVAANVTTFVDTTIVRNTTYSYRVQATSATLSPSAWSNTAQVVTPDFPLAPTTLTAVFQSGPQVSLNWTDNATNETGFIIQRAPDGVTFADIGTAPVRGGTGSVTFLDTTVMLPNTTYTYRVAAVNGTVGSAWSNTAQATTGNFPLPPTLVSLTATRVGTTANDRVRVVWSDVAGETGYTVQRSTNATFTSSLVTANFAANVTNYTTGNLPRNITYYFRVRATSAVSPSVWSNVMSVLTP
jgi:FtsP/CotA-like multicopper oxidase with cupredoxin domain